MAEYARKNIWHVCCSDRNICPEGTRPLGGNEACRGTDILIRTAIYDRYYYAESPSGAEGPARAVALLDNMYDAFQFKCNQIESKWKFRKKYILYLMGCEKILS
jgi:hypothetical protein